MKKLLVFDDDKTQGLIKTACQNQCEVPLVDSESDPLSIIEMENPELVLLGFSKEAQSLIEAIKKKSPHLRVAIINGERSFCESLLNAGADNFFESPLDMGRLQNYLMGEGIINEPFLRVRPLDSDDEK